MRYICVILLINKKSFMSNLISTFSSMPSIDKVMFIVWSIGLIGMAISFVTLIIKIIFNPKTL